MMRGETVSKPTPAPAPVTPVAESGEKKEYEEARLQIRLPDGSAMVHAFKAKETLSAVRLYVELNRKDGLAGPVKLMTSFPRKVFNDEEYETPLDVLGLVPSAVLMVCK